jgi:hypothetical protein
VQFCRKTAEEWKSLKYRKRERMEILEIKRTRIEIFRIKKEKKNGKI